jgi:CBS domain-containing protein
MRRISVGDIMTRNLITVMPEASLYQCSKIMAKEHINSLIIADGKKLVGILTARKVLGYLAKQPNIDLRKTNCMKIATQKVAVIKPSAELSHALEKMRTLNFRRLPVLSRGELIGVITLRDILAVEPSLYKEVHHIMDEIRESDRKQVQVGKQWPLEGLCENCGAFSDLLKVEKSLLCQDCREELY